VHAGRNNYFGRLSFVQKDADDLAVTLSGDPRFDIYSLSLGLIREVGRIGHASFGLGGRLGISRIPASLEAEYGSRTPAGVAIYLRVMPAESSMIHAGSP
jgi:hypothetical protein